MTAEAYGQAPWLFSVAATVTDRRNKAGNGEIVAALCERRSECETYRLPIRQRRSQTAATAHLLCPQQLLSQALGPAGRHRSRRTPGPRWRGRSAGSAELHPARIAHVKRVERAKLGSFALHGPRAGCPDHGVGGIPAARLSSPNARCQAAGNLSHFPLGSARLSRRVPSVLPWPGSRLKAAGAGAWPSSELSNF